MRSLLTTDKTVSTAGLYAADAKSIKDLNDNIGKIKIDQLYSSTNIVASGAKISIPNLLNYDFVFIVFYSDLSVASYDSSGTGKVGSVSHFEKVRTDCCFCANMPFVNSVGSVTRVISRWCLMESDGIKFNSVYMGIANKNGAMNITDDNVPGFLNPRYIYGIKAFS